MIHHHRTRNGVGTCNENSFFHLLKPCSRKFFRRRHRTRRYKSQNIKHSRRHLVSRILISRKKDWRTISRFGLGDIETSAFTPTTGRRRRRRRRRRVDRAFYFRSSFFLLILFIDFNLSFIFTMKIHAFSNHSKLKDSHPSVINYIII